LHMKLEDKWERSTTVLALPFSWPLDNNGEQERENPTDENMIYFLGSK
jgi:hypothetical protein